MFCTKCGKEYDENAKICPNCGFNFSQSTQNKKPNKFLQVLGIIIAIFFALGIIGSFIPDSDQTKNSVNDNSQHNTSKKPKLEVLNSSFCTLEFGARGICGTVINNSKRNYNYAQVEINLYDNSGSIVGSTLSNINNLESGQQWKFKAPILENNVAKYEIKDVTGF